MPTTAQTVSLNLMASAVETLRSQYAVPVSLEQERDNLKTFMHLILTGVGSLVSEAEADPDYLTDIECISDDINDAFHDAISADEARTAVAYTQASHGTLNHQQQFGR